MLKNITITNFRGIKELTIEDFGRVNLLVGGNNSGKTSVLEAVFIASNPASLTSPLAVNSIRASGNIPFSTEHAIDDTWKACFYQLQANNAIHINSTFFPAGGVKETSNLTITPSRKKTSILPDGTAAWVSSESSSLITGLKYYVTYEEDNIKHEFNAEIFGIPSKEQTLRIEEDKNNKPYTPKYSAHFSALNKGNVLSPDSLQSIFKNQQIEDRIITILRNLIDNIKGLYINDGQAYIDAGFGKLNTHYFGDGVGNILHIITTMCNTTLNTPNGMALFDEIDTGLHYSIQKKVWEAVLTTAKANNVQVFATTHSDECIAALNEAYREVWKDKEEDEIRLYRIQKSKDGSRMNAVQYTSDNLLNSEELGWEVR